LVFSKGKECLRGVGMGRGGAITTVKVQPCQGCSPIAYKENNPSGDWGGKSIPVDEKAERPLPAVGLQWERTRLGKIAGGRKCWKKKW